MLNTDALANYSPIRCLAREGTQFRKILDLDESYDVGFGIGSFGATREVYLFVD